MKCDLNFLLEKPDFSVKAKLTIDALTPLSMVTSMPGKYYRSQPEPTTEMLCGLLENALGWHISTKERKELLKELKREHRQEPFQSGIGYASLLQFHLRIIASLIPPMKYYDDLWSQHLKHIDERHINGSRNYDYHVIPTLNKIKSGEVKMNPGEIRMLFPQYYVSPTPREYVVPEGVYKFIIETSATLAQMFAEAVEHPAAPLYLGSNDGWVEVEWEVIQ